MSNKLNKTCIICREKYSYCPSCSKDSDKPTWYTLFHDENCHRIYEVCTSYRDGIYDKKKAYEEITKCDLSKLEDFKESTKNQIEEILGYAKEQEKPEPKQIKVENKNVQNKNVQNRK